jgi:hypothetical protein
VENDPADEFYRSYMGKRWEGSSVAWEFEMSLRKQHCRHG